jgi:uncharacterized protein YraI
MEGDVMAWNPNGKWAGGAIGAGALLLLSAGIAAAAPALATANVNMRQGPGTQYGVITTIPGGSTVEVINCTGEWCNVQWQGRGGYAIARNLDLGGGPGPGPGGPVVVGPPGPPVVVVDPYPYPYYWGRRGYWGPRRYGWRRW